MARTAQAGRTRFSKNVLEAHLYNRREILEEQMLKLYGFTMHRGRREQALPHDAPRGLVLLMGQWITTQDLIDDFIDDVIRARPSAFPAPEPSLKRTGT